jgi:L-cysteine desulfidase
MVIAGIETAEAEAIFGKFCAQFGRDGDLEEAAWRLAAVFLPGESFARQRSQLDTWGAEVARRLKKATTPLDQIETLVEFLAHEVGLRGNADDYYNVNNSLLPEVIDMRLGIPITLSLIYILVGQRVGISISGAGLPGHFLIRHGHEFFDQIRRKILRRYIQSSMSQSTSRFALPRRNIS